MNKSLIKSCHLSFKDKKDVSEDELIKEFIESRKDTTIKYFVLDLVTIEYDISGLVKFAIRERQCNALGYVCDVVAPALPSDLQSIREKMRDISDKLYFFRNSEWEHLCFGLSDWGKN